MAPLARPNGMERSPKITANRRRSATRVAAVALGAVGWSTFSSPAGAATVSAEPVTPEPPGDSLVTTQWCNTDAGYSVSEGTRGPTKSRLNIGVIGVYEGGDDGIVDVDVHRIAGRQVLVLTAYESVVWRLRVDDDVDLDRILVSGYEPAVVEGEGDTPVVEAGTAYSYGADALITIAEDLLEPGEGARIDAAGCYDATSFLVGTA